MTTQPGCDAPNCKCAALFHIAAVGPIGEVDGFFCGTHAQAFKSVFPVHRSVTALLLAVTSEELLADAREVMGHG